MLRKMKALHLSSPQRLQQAVLLADRIAASHALEMMVVGLKPTIYSLIKYNSLCYKYLNCETSSKQSLNNMLSSELTSE